MSLISMTGHGTGRAGGASGSVSVEITSVNRKQLDVQSHVPPGWQKIEAMVARQVGASLARGRVHASVRWQGEGATLGIDEEALKEWLAALRGLGERVGLSDDLCLSQAIRFLDQWRSGDAETMPEGAGLLVEDALAEALAACVVMRTAEGGRLQEELAGQLSEARDSLARVREAVPSLVDARATRLRERLEAGGVDFETRSPTWEREMALIADKMDVREELVRLEAHFDAVDALMTAGGEAGRKLDFLLQEIFREVNTLSVKCADATVSRDLVDVKAALEKMREQVQNIE